MRKFLSRIEAVFCLPGRGCVVHPGIPAASETRIKIGDPLWLVRPGEPEIRTTVRGIEMGGTVPSSGVAVLLDSEILEGDLLEGALLFHECLPTSSFVIRFRPQTQAHGLSDIFKTSEDGKLHFGWSGRSVLPASISDVQSSHVEFLDYVMEGFVSYHLVVSLTEAGMAFDVSLHGSNRDEYVRSLLRHNLSSFGYEELIEAEDGTTRPH